MRKGEIAYNKRFLLFSQCFLLYMALIFHFKCTLKCRLQFVSIWTSLKFCRLGFSRLWFLWFLNEFLLSLPEHEVLMVSFCNRPMSVARCPSCAVRRPSCFVHNLFKHLLLLNHWANLNETWQGCSLGEALPKLFKRLNSSLKSGYHGNQNEKNSKIFENLLLRN